MAKGERHESLVCSFVKLGRTRQEFDLTGMDVSEKPKVPTGQAGGIENRRQRTMVCW